MSNILKKAKSSKVINAWCSYDMANSGYSLCIATVLYPVYFESASFDAFGSDIVSFLGFSIKNTVLYEYATALAYLVAILTSLALSGIADKLFYRKRFMQYFTWLGAMSCIGMYWYTGSNLVLGVVLPALAILGFVCSFVFYNSFLPLIAPKSKVDKVSAKGYAFGYSGSMLLLLFILFQVEKYAAFGFASKTQAVRFAFVEVGIWWLLVSQIAFAYLKEEPQKFLLSKRMLLHGFYETKKVFYSIKKNVLQYCYLLAFFCFSVGVQTIMIIASLIVSVELKLSHSSLIQAILLVQITGVLGATLIGHMANRVSDKSSLLLMIVIWIAICLGGKFIQSANQFYIIAAITGLVMGGIQSQSRALWSKFMPKNEQDTASYFTFYDSAERLALVVGMFFFGFIDKVSGSLRLAMVSLSVFFFASLVIVAFTSFSKLKKH